MPLGTCLGAVALEDSPTQKTLVDGGQVEETVKQEFTPVNLYSHK